MLIHLFIFCLSLTYLFSAHTETTTQTFNIAISAIDELAINGTPPSLTISSGTPGVTDMEVSAANSTYAYTTNSSLTKLIKAKIDTAMPSNTSLTINLTAPTAGSSSGNIVLTASDQTVVTISTTPSLQSAITITYTFKANVNASQGSFNRTVTLTLTE